MAKKKTKSKNKTKTKPKKKSATLSLRITPEIKAVASRLAGRGRRSLNGLVEFLIKKEAQRLADKERPRNAKS
jgi:predicted HicB family RNase H-like nuclease